MTCILLTEDQSQQRAMYHAMLTDAGYIVYCAASIMEALELYERCQPDLVLMDIQTPGIHANQPLGKILSHDRTTPVIFFNSSPAIRVKISPLSSSAFIETVENPHELLDVVRKVSRARGIPVGVPLPVE